VAFLPTSPLQSEIPYLSFDWIWDSFTVLPIQMFNWISRPQEDFHKKAAAAGMVLIILTCSMNALAMIIRRYYRRRIKW
jgi:phosphate transport system permease protein